MARLEALSHEELQHIEHSNKILKEHLELVRSITTDTSNALNEFTPRLRNYLNGIVDIRQMFAKEVMHIVNSTRELKVITSGAQEIINFVQAVERLDKVLTPELIDKLNRLKV